MRKINKQEPPECLTAFISRQKPRKWDEIYTPQNHHIYDTCRNTMLIMEQDYQCGYTEMPLKKENMHIDHYRKRADFPDKTFDWNNLIVALKDNDFGADYKDNGYKIREKEYSSILNPVTDLAQSYFEYRAAGEIVPAKELSPSEYDKAKKTIEVFNLTHRSLNNRRKKLIIDIENCRNGKMTKEDILKFYKEAGFKSVLEPLLSE
ncbi:hypothetical protein EZS27_028093 [termite gut metagenome]|uniref:TIGR02646 family protein n=1 Tax=termite gut metagenome TaxID=433724 RepID=A0A5J4QKG5_9ZZZZ